MTDQTLDSVPTPPATPVGEDTKPVPQPAAPAQPSEDWQKKYAGLQTAYNKLDQRYKQALADAQALQARVEELEQGLKGTDAEREKLLADLSTSKEKNVELEGERQKLAATVARKDLILAEFPGLAVFEQKGLIPPADGEEHLRQVLADFQTALTGTVEESVQQRISGAVPQTPRGKDEAPMMGADELYDQMMDIAGKDPDKFAELQKQWDALSATQ